MTVLLGKNDLHRGTDFRSNLPSSLFRCNQQIAVSSLLVKGVDVTRSIVQRSRRSSRFKSHLWSMRLEYSCPTNPSATQEPTPIRPKLGIVTTPLFNQESFPCLTFPDSACGDFTDSTTLHLLRGQLTESGLYMGTPHLRLRFFPFFISTLLYRNKYVCTFCTPSSPPLNARHVCIFSSRGHSRELVHYLQLQLVP